MGDVGSDLQMQLRYPSAWFAPVALSAFAQTIGKCTIEWLDELGLLKDAATRDHVLAMEPHHYAGYSHSMASYDHALLYSKYITLWLLWDDQVVERANHIQDAMRPLHALGGGTCDWSDPFCVGFRQIGDGYVLHGATSEWRWRFSNVMLEWAQHAVAEEMMRREAMHSTPQMAFTEALRQRSFTVGIRPNSIPLERAAGFELPAFVYSSAIYARLMDAAARICCLVNDLVGIRKDIANGQISSNPAHASKRRRLHKIPGGTSPGGGRVVDELFSNAAVHRASMDLYDLTPPSHITRAKFLAWYRLMGPRRLFGDTGCNRDARKRTRCPCSGDGSRTR